MPSEDAVGRATVIARSCLGRDVSVQRVEQGESNDVWFAGHIVVRVARQPGSSDLLSEVGLVARLDPAVGYPEVVGSGIHDGHEWMATARLPGHNLAALWPRLGFAGRAAAMADLWTRLTAVHATNIEGLRDHDATPFYQLDHETAVHELRELSVLDPATLHAVEEILRGGFDAIAGQPLALVHTDASPGNTVWDGRRAIPIDFEFACLAPSDLDIDNVARALAHTSVDQLEPFRRRIRAHLAAQGSTARLRAYAVLRDSWAVSKWIANAPERHNIDDWEPVQQLRAHAAGTSWTSAFLT